MKFKESHLQGEYHSRHTFLQQMAADFEGLSRAFGIEPVVTRVLEEFPGSSGVHEAGRGIDFRDEHLERRLYKHKQVESILALINRKYARNDGFSSLIHHGSPLHFHLQMAPTMGAYVVKVAQNPQRESPQSPDQDSSTEHGPSSSGVLGLLSALILSCLATWWLIAG